MKILSLVEGHRLPVATVWSTSIDGFVSCLADTDGSEVKWICIARQTHRDTLAGGHRTCCASTQ